MDLKVLLLCIVKALLEALLTPPDAQEQWNLFRWVVVFFLAHLFQTSWSDIVSPAQKHFHSSLLTPPQASSSINVVQEQPIEITPNFTTHQDWNHPKLPRRMGISSLDVLLHWRKKSWEDSYSKLLSFWSKVCRTQSFKFLWTSWITGRWLQIPHSKPIPHVLKFNSSLLFYASLFPLQFCDIFLFRKPIMNHWLDIPKQIFARTVLKGGRSLCHGEKWSRFL